MLIAKNVRGVLRSIRLDEIAMLDKFQAIFCPYSPYFFKNFSSFFVKKSPICGWVCSTLYNHIIGCVVVQIIEDEGEILTFWVLPEFRQKGIGKFFLKFILERFSHVSFVLDVAQDNEPALALYKSLGFQIVGKRPSYYPSQHLGAIDAWVMRCVALRNISSISNL